MPRPRGHVAGLAIVLLLAAGTAAAQTADDTGAPAATPLAGTLKAIKASGVVTIGYRESSIPFSYRGKDGAPLGYAVDLCKEVADEIGSELDTKSVRIAYKPVTSESRIPALLAGQIDLECGSTTSNFERRKQVAFSPIYFVAGTKLLVPHGSPIASYRDLGGKTVVVTAGTTNEGAVRAIAQKQGIAVTIVVGKDHAESFAMLKAGKVDAFATDDVLLYGFVATSGTTGKFDVVGGYLSYDPYGLMYRKGDPEFAAIVDRTFARLASSGELVRLYDKWFKTRLPTGETLDLPMSPQLEEIFRVEGVPD